MELLFDFKQVWLWYIIIVQENVTCPTYLLINLYE